MAPANATRSFVDASIAKAQSGGHHVETAATDMDYWPLDGTDDASMFEHEEQAAQGSSSQQRGQYNSIFEFTVNSKYTVKAAGWDVDRAFPPKWGYRDLASSFRDVYAGAKPFKHIYIDNLYPIQLLRQCADEFFSSRERALGPDGGGALASWNPEYNDGENQFKKLHLRDEEHMGPASLAMIGHFRSSIFISFLESITGRRPPIYMSLFKINIHREVCSCT